MNLHASFMHKDGTDGLRTIEGPSLVDLAAKLRAAGCEESAWLRALDASGTVRGWVRVDGKWRSAGVA
jgi:hypothetical protein